MRIDICIPAYNEEPIIERAVVAVRNTLAPFPDARVVVAANGCTDETEAKAKASGAAVMRVATRGKGAAVIAAAKESTADIFGFIDADLSADPQDIPTLLQPLIREECDIVIGSRLTDETTVRRAYFRTASSRLFNALRRMLIGVHVTDSQCGLKLMDPKGRAVLARCTETGWFFDMEFLARAERAGLRVRELRVHWDEHRFPERVSKLNMFRDGFGALRAMLRIQRKLQSTRL